MAETYFKLNDFEQLIEKTVEKTVSEVLKNNLPKTEVSNRRLITRTNLAKMLQCSLPTLDRNSDKGIFRRIEIAGKVYYDLEEVDEVLNK